MTDDLIERLRSPATVFYEYSADTGTLLKNAADEIERLREQVAKLTIELIRQNDRIDRAVLILDGESDD